MEVVWCCLYCVALRRVALRCVEIVLCCIVMYGSCVVLRCVEIVWCGNCVALRCVEIVLCCVALCCVECVK